MPNSDIQKIIEKLGLDPLPGEGGYFKRTYESKLFVDSKSVAGEPINRPTLTAIYFLITEDSFSGLHRLPSDEIFHFYAGDPVKMVQMNPTGAVKSTILGTDILAGQIPQHLVPAGDWQGSMLVQGGRWSLLGTTMSPGFEFADLELASEVTLKGLRGADQALLRGYLPRI